MLAGFDGLGEKAGPHLGRAGIEEDRVPGLAQSRVQIRRQPGNAMTLGDLRQLLVIAPDQDWIGHDAIAIGKQGTALVADG